MKSNLLFGKKRATSLTDLLKKLFVLLFVSIAFSLNLSAQEATAYQKRCNEIYTKYYLIFTYGYEKSLTLEEELTLGMAFGMLSPEGAVAIAALNASQQWPMSKIEKLTTNMKSELKKAESLMTAEERKEKARQDAREKLAETSVGRLKLLIADSLDMWATKEEFEKTDEWKSRMEQESKTRFLRYCKKLFPSYSFTVSPLKYDADKEEYLFNIKYELDFYNKTIKEELNTTIPVNVSDAKGLNDKKINATDVVWGVVNDKIYPKAFNIIINDNKYPVTTQAKDLTIDARQLPIQNEYIGPASYNYTQMAIKRIQNQAIIQQAIIGYNTKLQLDADSLNHLITTYAYAYQPHKYQIAVETIPLKEYDDVEKEIMIEYENSLSNMAAKKDEALQKMKEDFRRYDSDKYVKVYLAENSLNADYINAAYVECRCNYSFTKFVIAYEDGNGNIPNCNCRESFWSRYKDVFASREEFDQAYNLSNGEWESELRSHLNRKSKFDDISYYIDAVRMSNLQSAANSSNSYIKKVYQYLQETKGDNLYYPKAIDKLFRSNTAMHDEYEKQSKYYESRKDFVEDYLSAKYKNNLKERKKTYKKANH